MDITSEIRLLSLSLSLTKHCVLAGRHWPVYGVGLRYFSLHVAMIGVILRSILVCLFKQHEQADRVASEYHPNHYHMERGGSKTHPIHRPVPSCQHTVLSLISEVISNIVYCFIVYHYFLAPSVKTINLFRL